MTRVRTIVVAIGGALVALSGLGVATAVIAGGSDGERVVAAPKTASDGPKNCVAPRASADGAASAPTWAGTPPANRAKNALDQKIENRFGDYTVIGQREMLSRGLIGIARDSAQRVVVLTDPAADIDEVAFEAELQQTSAAYHRDHPNSPMIGVRVQEACHSAAELIRASAVITGRDWHPRATDAVYTSFLDATDATFHVTFQDSDRDVGEALKAKLGPLVTLDYAPGPPAHTDPRF